MSKYTNEELVDLIRNSTGKEQENYLAILYNQNYGMIHKICKTYSAYDCVEDLEQESFFGLRTAVDYYDPGKGVLFMSYASYWIKQSARRYLDECGSVLRLPAHIRDQVFHYDQVVKDYQRRNGRKPTDSELMRALTVDAKKLQQIKKYAVYIRPASLDKAVSMEDDTFTLGETVADPNDHFQNLDDQLDDEILKQTLWDEVDKLTEKQADLIRKRFKQNKTLKETADSMGTTIEGARSIQRCALHKMRRSSSIRQFAEEYISAKAYSGTGLSAFMNSGSSATERTALDLYDNGIETYLRQLDHDLKRIEKKYHIELDEEFKQKKINEILEEKNV